MNDRSCKTNRHTALNAVMVDQRFPQSTQPTPLAWTCNDLIVAAILVGVLAALFLGGL